jgi:hypothetical protein
MPFATLVIGTEYQKLKKMSSFLRACCGNSGIHTATNEIFLISPCSLLLAHYSLLIVRCCLETVPPVYQYQGGSGKKQ